MLKAWFVYLKNPIVQGFIMNGVRRDEVTDIIALRPRDPGENPPTDEELERQWRAIDWDQRGDPMTREEFASCDFSSAVQIAVTDAVNRARFYIDYTSEGEVKDDVRSQVFLAYSREGE